LEVYMKVYKQFLTGIAAIALLFSGLSGCESPVGDTGPRGLDVPNHLSIETDVSVVAPGGSDHVFRAIFKGENVSSSVLTRWEISGDGLYANWSGPGTPVDGRSQFTYFTYSTDYVTLNVAAGEQAETLMVTASHGGYSASAVLTLGARGLEFIRLIPGSTDGTTRIDLHDLQGGSLQGTELTQPEFGYYFVYEKSDTPDRNVAKGKTLNAPKTVNEIEDIMVKNGDWINVYEVPQDELLNTKVHGYVSLQVHSSASEIYKGLTEGELLAKNVIKDEEPHNVLVPNLYEPLEYHTPSLTAPNTVLEIGNPGSGTTAPVSYGLTTYPVVFEGKYNAWAIDQASWEALEKDAALALPGSAVPISGATVTLPTVGEWQLVVQHTQSGAWWDIDTAKVVHNMYSKNWDKTLAQNVLTVTLSGGKKLIKYNGIAVNGIPFAGEPLSTWNTDPLTGNTSVTLYLGDLDLTVSAAKPTTPEQQFVAGTGSGVIVSIPADHFLSGTAPVIREDPDVQISWSEDSVIRGRVIVTGVKLDDDEKSYVEVRNDFTGATITEHFNFQWFYVNGTTWEPAPARASADDPAYGQWFNSYTGGGTEKDLYLGLKVTPQSGYVVSRDSEFVFGKFTD
jgi:hypothetical protein